MNPESRVEAAERALVDFRREIAGNAGDGIDLLAVERKVQELTSAYGRALMREVLLAADTQAPEVMIEGER